QSYYSKSARQAGSLSRFALALLRRKYCEGAAAFLKFEDRPRIRRGYVEAPPGLIPSFDRGLPLGGVRRDLVGSPESVVAGDRDVRKRSSNRVMQVDGDRGMIDAVRQQPLDVLERRGAGQSIEDVA